MSSQHSEDEAARLLEDLKRLSDFSMSLLTSENIRPESLYSRKAYVYSQFIFTLAMADGVITLAQQGQARAMVPLVRALWEGWVGVAFVYVSKSNIWAYYLGLQEELKNKKKRDGLYKAGKMKEADYKKRDKEATKLINFIKRRYKELPLVPGVITVNERDLTKRKISLKEKCQIIDYYNSLKPKYSPTATTLAEWYDSAYGLFSGTAHASVTELNGLFKHDPDGNLHVDISGGADRKYLSSLLLVAYLYHYLLMKVFITSISTSKQRIPDDIKAARRRMTGARFKKI